jgi:hypothetical protein
MLFRQLDIWILLARSMHSATIEGKYRHYKGHEYVVLGIAHHSETLEELVVYQGLYDDPEFGHHPIWVRPKSMFFDEVVFDGKKMKRFTKID